MHTRSLLLLYFRARAYTAPVEQEADGLIYREYIALFPQPLLLPLIFFAKITLE